MLKRFTYLSISYWLCQDKKKIQFHGYADTVILMKVCNTYTQITPSYLSIRGW